MQGGVHGFTLELDVTTLLYGERLERDDRQRVFHLSLIEHISACEAKIVDHIVTHAQFTPSYQINIIAVVSVEVAFDACALIHVQSQVHVESIQRRSADYLLRSRVVEIHESHQFIKSVVSGKWRIAQHISHIGSPQYA